MTVHSETADPARKLLAHCRAYKGASLKDGIIQLAVTAALFAAVVGGMLAAHVFHLWWAVACLALPAAGLLIRLFVIQHDCGHGSFFHSRKANDAIGRLISVLTITPYDAWKRAHNIHHAGSGNLDKRGVGAIDTLTVREYQALPWYRRTGYRIYRNPFVLLLLGTPAHLIVIQRLPLRTIAPFFESYQAVPGAVVWRGVILLDLAMAGLYGGLGLVFGWQVLLTVWLPVIVLTSWIGGWLFFIQHQFEHTYWQPGENWAFPNAALGGSSYLVLPRALQWFTGNIGLHHIHHLCSSIPNYRLQECLDNNSELQNTNRMTAVDSFKCFRWSLWDERDRRMVTFNQLKSLGKSDLSRVFSIPETQRPALRDE